MDLKDDIFNISGRKSFEKIALKVFRHQYSTIAVYREFCDRLNVDVQKVKTLQQVPFLPISFFKSHDVLPDDTTPEVIFTSSGTTGAITSKHQVLDVSVYEKSFRCAFSKFYGNIDDYVILALLPSYLERGDSSLVYMFKDLIAATNSADSGFYLNNYPDLIQKVNLLESEGRNLILIGVTYALLDLVEMHKFDLKSTIVMETGGMKGRRREMIREELHHILCEGFGVANIHSEYGMTELLSQAYSFGKGLFQTPPWMQVLIRDPEDALTLVGNNKSGGVNIIDLANYNSCAFIATQDLGKTYDDGSFEILGRFDNADIRGCNLMVL